MPDAGESAFDYAGCIHFHSAYSYDADAPLGEIVQAGLRAGLRYAILTDHFRMDARRDGWEGYHAPEFGRGLDPARRLLLIVGEEISPRYNHYLALGMQKPVVVWKTHLDAQETINAVNERGGFGFLAHPDHEGAPLRGLRAYPWIAWDARGFAGLGIWDLMGDWTSALTTRLGILRACLWPALALRGPRPSTLERWDALAQKSHCVAIAEADNHGHRRRFFGWRRRLFSFEFAFRALRTHVLLAEKLSGEAASDQRMILQALRRGRSYVSLDLWQDPSGFCFAAFDEARRATMGEEFERRGPALWEVKLPAAGRFRLIRNGRIIYEERRRAYAQRDLDLPGVYRVEADQYVRGRWRPWIYSNPIWVR